MYHTEIKKQDLNIKKSFILKGFSSKDLQTYIATCTPFEQQIAHYLLKFRYMTCQKLLNSTIAKKVGCSRITVIRATNKFHKDGFITKQQPQPYDANFYTFDEKVKKGPAAFSYWLNNTSSEKQDLFISHGIVIDHKNKKIGYSRNDTPYLSSLILESNFKNSYSSPTRVREGGGDFSKKLKGEMMKPHENIKPLEPKKTSRMYPVWKSPEKPSKKERIDFLEKEIDSMMTKLADPTLKRQFAAEHLIKIYHKKLEECIQELEELGRSNEKQILSHQYHTDTMAAYSS